MYPRPGRVALKASRYRTLSSDSLVIPRGTALYHPGATLQVERCARDVAGSYTLPVRRVTSEPDLAIYP